MVFGYPSVHPSAMSLLYIISIMKELSNLAFLLFVTLHHQVALILRFKVTLNYVSCEFNRFSYFIMYKLSLYKQKEEDSMASEL